mgnify:CR=1 FL=1
MLKVNAGEYFVFISYTVSMFKTSFLDLIEWVVRAKHKVYLFTDTLKLCGVHLV